MSAKLGKKRSFLILYVNSKPRFQRFCHKKNPPPATERLRMEGGKHLQLSSLRKSIFSKVKKRKANEEEEKSFLPSGNSIFSRPPKRFLGQQTRKKDRERGKREREKREGEFNKLARAYCHVSVHQIKPNRLEISETTLQICIAILDITATCSFSYPSRSFGYNVHHRYRHKWLNG